MRGTIHLVSARDARRLVPLMRPVARRGWATGSPFGRMAQGLDVDALLAAGRELLEDAPRSTAELRRELALRWPDRDPDGLAMTVRYLLPLAQLPPRGVWGKSGHPRWAPLESWLGEALEPDPSIDDVVLRYLAAFGPASVMDVQAWCWLTRLREVVERLRPGLVTFRDERGRELFDLPDAPRPEAETPAPVRFIPPYDNIALSHDDRARVIAATDRDRLFTHGGVLVEGFVAGAWAIRRGRRAAVLEIEPFRPLEAGEEEAVRAEGGRLLEFAAGGAAERSIELTALPNWHRERRLARASEAADVAG